MHRNRKFFFLLISLLTFFAARSLARVTLSQDQKESKVLQNADIVQMVQNQFDDETLLTVIEVNDTKFDVSPASLIELKKAGVSDRVIRAMLQASIRKSSAAGSANPSSLAPTSTTAAAAGTGSAVTSAPEASAGASAMTVGSGRSTAASGGVRGGEGGMDQAGLQAQLASMGMGGMGGMFSVITPEQMPHVYLMSRPSKEEISSSTAQIAQSKMKMGGPSQGSMLLHSAASTALSFAAIGAGPGGMMAMSAFSMGSSMMGRGRAKGPTITYVWGLPGLHASRGLNTTTPMFQLNFGDIPGVDPDEYEPALVRLVQTKDNYRLVGATQSQMGMMGGGGASKWVSEDRVPVRLDKEERGVYVVHVDQPLAPGEYAVVLHPFKGQTLKPSGFSGMSGMGGMGMGGGFGAGPQLFYSVWDFTISAPRK